MLARTTTCARESCLVNRLHLRIKDEDRMVFSGIPIKRERRGKLQNFFISDKSRIVDYGDNPSRGHHLSFDAAGN